MKFSINNKDLYFLNESTPPDFPKYTSQLMNLANQNAQGTRPRVVGQMSDLFSEYIDSATEISLDGWRKWYLERYPDTINKATEKIFNQVLNLKIAISVINESMIRDWVEDLVITKTYTGLYFQKAILSKIASLKGLPFRLASPKEEALGIDGYVGDIPYSIKPDTYKSMERLSETIGVTMVYYTKVKTGIGVEVKE